MAGSERLRELIRRAAGAEGTLGLAAGRRLARECGLETREVEIAALEENLPPKRYLRNIAAFGLEGQRSLLSSRAAVIGAGGLGGYVIEILARAGVGELVVVDGDRFAEGNLNRQLLATEENLGTAKARAAARRVESINSAIRVEAHEFFLDADNAGSLIRGCDVAVDALDSISSRLLLEEAAAREGIPLVHGSIGGFFGQVALSRPGEKILRRIFGENGEDHGIEEVWGTPTPVPAVIAAIQAGEAIKLLLGRSSPLEGCLLLADIDAELYSLLPLGREDS